MLTTDRLCLVEPEDGYLEPLFKIHHDPATNLYNPAGPVERIEDFEITLKEWQQHFSQHGFGYYAMSKKADGKVFGVCGLRWTELQNKPYLNLYYRIDLAETRKGYVKEACRAVIEDVMERTEYKYEVVAQTKKNNIPSIRTAESLGLIHNQSFDDYKEDGNVFYFSEEVKSWKF